MFSYIRKYVPLAQTALESLSFQNVGCSIAACNALDELVTHTQSLQQLHLFNNMSGDEGAAAIARIVSRSPCLKDLKMVSSRVGLEGGCALGQALAAGGLQCGR